MKLNIGCGNDYRERFINVDISRDVRADNYIDLNTCSLANPLPFEDNSFDEILAFNVLEYIPNIFPLLEELYRVAKPGCPLIIKAAYDDYCRDPLLAHNFVPASFYYFTQPYKTNPAYSADWNVKEIAVLVPPTVARELEKANSSLDYAITHLKNIASDHLVAMTAEKPAREARKELQEIVRPVAQVTEDV